MNNHTSARGPLGLTTVASLVSAMFLGTLIVPVYGATPSNEVIGEVGTIDASAEAQSTLDKGQYLWLTGKVAND